MENNGYFTSIGTIWNTRGDDDSVRIFYMETEPIHTTNSNARTRSRLQEVGRYYYKIDWPTKIGTNGSKKISRNIQIINRDIRKKRRKYRQNNENYGAR